MDIDMVLILHLYHNKLTMPHPADRQLIWQNDALETITPDKLPETNDIKVLASFAL